MKRSLTLFLPGLLPEILKQDGENLVATPSFAAMVKLLSRATCRPQSTCSIEQSLKNFFDGLGTTNLPAGALTALSHDLISIDDRGIWCRADPVEFLVDQQTAYMLGNAHLLPQEQKPILAKINTLFQQDGMELTALNSNEWVCRVTEHTDVVMNDFLEAIRKNLRFYLPSGPDEGYWRRLITECQMLLTSPKQAGCLGLWFWGIGPLPLKVHTLFDGVCSNDSVIQGLGKCAQVPVSSLPTQWDPSLVTTHTHLLCADMRLVTYIKHQLYEKWHSLLVEYEEKWFQPLLRALAENHLHSLIIDCADGREFIITKKNLNYFWRRVRPLTAFGGNRTVLNT